MTTVIDMRRGGIELGIREFMREVKRQVRSDLPKRSGKATISIAVATRLVMGQVQLPQGIGLPASMAVVGIARHFGGVVYHWRCPGCWRPYLFLYQWRGETVYRCRRCWGLRYTSQAWARMSPLWRAIAGESELDVLAQQRHAHIGHVGRPPTRKLQRLAAREQRWWVRLGDALELASLSLR